MEGRIERDGKEGWMEGGGKEVGWSPLRNIRSLSSQLGGLNVCTGGASLSVYGLKGYGLEGLSSRSSSGNEDMN